MPKVSLAPSFQANLRGLFIDTVANGFGIFAGGTESSMGLTLKPSPPEKRPVRPVIHSPKVVKVLSLPI
jgi:hypothetical protein